MTRRTVLFSPGDQPELLRKAPTTGADVVVFDLEDAVSPAEKETARGAVADAVTELDAECELCVRINPLDAGGQRDLDSLESVMKHVDSLMLPKVSGPTDVDSVCEVLGHDETPVLALLETAAGVLAAVDIAAVDAVDALLLGAEDLSADVGLTRTESGTEVLYARQRVVLAASAHGVDAIDTLWTNFEDTAGLTDDAELAVEFGFDGKMAIHPAQIPVINDAFTPDPAQIEWAQNVLDAREAANEAQQGVFSVDGEMIDAPLIRQAEKIVAVAESAGVLE